MPSNTISKETGKPFKYMSGLKPKNGLFPAQMDVKDMFRVYAEDIKQRGVIMRVTGSGAGIIQRCASHAHQSCITSRR